MLIVQHHGTQTPISYKHVINPIKLGNGKFAPNWREFDKVQDLGSKMNIHGADFDRVQSEGKIILINFAGGWCTMTYGMDILEGEELLDKELLRN